jgi:hypothetical protein
MLMVTIVAPFSGSHKGGASVWVRRIVARLGWVVGFSVEGMRLVLNSEGRTSRIVRSTDDVAVSTMAPALIGLSEQFATRLDDLDGCGRRVRRRSRFGGLGR